MWVCQPFLTQCDGDGQLEATGLPCLHQNLMLLNPESEEKGMVYKIHRKYLKGSGLTQLP